ncbi:hypothetical protein [Sphingomonas immobilis]|uniref:Uncharacterized protein n=1 Tax=Sphingomonas immobilis TaxID=3063997 RepID=A0ABT9A1X2_9SPHN|nr:hypothetical protein [Sphingomonas sp. CA1-15]MDO7843558.1 hypothetical protein [Sphingomonas sp. CA1-15]
MGYNEDQLEQMKMSQALAYTAVMGALTSLHAMPEEGPGAGAIDFFPTIDGLLQVIATLAMMVDAFPTKRDQRQFVETMRKGLLAHFVDAERDAKQGLLGESRRLDQMPWGGTGMAH